MGEKQCDVLRSFNTSYACSTNEKGTKGITRTEKEKAGTRNRIAEVTAQNLPSSRNM